MGMSGGFLSQSVVMPEIDGAIRPYALFGHHLDKEGLQRVYAIPERLERFVETVNKHIALQRKPNSEKRIAIYYYKGPGQNALTASGMEVAPSLYNLLLRLRREGYRVENLPASPSELTALIQQQGALFNAYAHGAKSEFLKTDIRPLSRQRSTPHGPPRQCRRSGWPKRLHSTANFREAISPTRRDGWHCRA